MMTTRANPVSTLWQQIAVTAAITSLLFAAGQARANGTNPTVVAGQASFSTLGNSLNISNSPGTIINWQGFSIGADETTRFIQQSAASSVLNRVIGPDPSSILGTLTSNGRVFLINPSGILVGQGAHIDVAGLVASTLNLNNQDFLEGRLNFSANPLAGTVENQGSITTPSGGSVYLVGANVTNSGIINSPQGDIILAAGQSVKIFDSSIPGVRVEVTASGNSVVNLGEILAQSGEAGIYGAALRNAGIIDADQVVRDSNGKIVLRAKQDVTLDPGSLLTANGEQGGEITVQSETGTTHISGTIAAKGAGEATGTGGTVRLLGNRVSLMAADVDASGTTGGGTVLVGGDYQGKNPSVQNASATSVSPDSSIKADAITSGDGGTVIVWSDGDTSIDGTLTARGGANSGNGGFIETSGKHVLLADDTRVNTLAPHGKTGLWLLDPVNWTISAAGDETPASVIASLSATDRTILADNDITVSDAIAWATGQTLTLNAGHNVLVNAAMTASTIGAGIELIAGNDVTATAALTASANTAVIDVSAGRNVSVATVTASGGGSVNLRANNNVIVNGVITADTNLDSVILQADNDGTGPGAAGGTVLFAGPGSVITPRAIIRFNPDGYANTSAEIANYATKVSALLDAKAWVFAQGNNKTYDGTNAAALSFKGTPTDGGAVTLVDPGSGATFSDKNAVAGKTITYAGFTLGGGDSDRFSLFGNGSGTATADINKAALGVTANSVTKTYDGTLAATGTGTVGAIAGAGDVVNSAGSQAFLDKNFGIGNKTVRASGVTIKDALNADMSNNYTITYTDNLVSTINKAALGVTANSVTKTYDGTLVATGTGTVGAIAGAGDVVNSAGSQAFLDKNLGIGNKTVRASGVTIKDALNADMSNNYTITYTDNLVSTINKAALAVTANSVTKTYDGTLAATGTGTVGAIAGAGDVVNSAGSQAFLDKNFGIGNKTVRASGVTIKDALNADMSGNYTITYTDNLVSTINKAALGVTANSVTKTYDGTLAATGTGTVGAIAGAGDVVNSAGSQAFLDKNFGIGNKTVRASGVTIKDALNADMSNNYTITYTDNLVSTINKAALAVTANSVTKTYGANDPLLSYTAGTFQFADSAATVLSGALSRAAGESVAGGPYAISQGSLAANSNYSLAYTGNTLTITPAPLAVAAHPQSKIFGTSDPALTFSVTGVVNNPALGITDTLETVLSGVLTRVPGESALGGPYAITRGSLAANSNYTLGFTPSNLIIIGAAAEPVLGFNAEQVVFVGVINNETYYRPGNFWHISLNPNNADPGFDVMRGTNDFNARLNRFDSDFGGDFFETWSFPQQFEKVDEK